MESESAKVMPQLYLSISCYVQVEDARRLVKFSKQEDVNTQGAVFNLVDELEVTRDRFFGRQVRNHVA